MSSTWVTLTVHPLQHSCTCEVPNFLQVPRWQLALLHCCIALTRPRSGKTMSSTCLRLTVNFLHQAR